MGGGSEGLQPGIEYFVPTLRLERCLDYHVVEETPDRFDVDVTGCRYARFFQELGEPELGFLLVCSADFSLAEGFEGVELHRTQTIMQGADHCDFRFRLKQAHRPCGRSELGRDPR